ncbi:MAG: beta-ketoacyl-[acyl-carrier-protein] synthase family protein [Chitinispirillaceae bacterium]|nr:beta-ketoacyl-[acyl-carrier-protein] synthase family protein [Chitinispirillaceae bacterium]
MKRRVVITGIGIVAPGSPDRDAFWNNALALTTVVAPVPPHWSLYFNPVSTVWAPLPEIDWARYPLSRVEVMQLDMTAKLAVAASWQALSQAGLDPAVADEKRNAFALKGVEAARSAVYLGTGMGGVCSFASNEGHQLYAPLQQALRRDTMPPVPVFPFVRCAPRFSPFAVSMSMPNGASAALGIKYSMTGVNRTIGGACAAGTMAVGEAFEAIARGEGDLVLAGGVEYLADDYGGVFRAFDIARTLVSTGEDGATVKGPFDRNRSGFLFAEGGCGVLVLEERGHALNRGAAPIAEILGYAETFDAHSAMAIDPSAQQIERMLAGLMDKAGISPSAVDYINTHGTGTVVNDDIEAGVIARLFGKRPVVNATKSLIGHTVGAAGAIEAAVTALTLRDQKVHGCANLCDPVADLHFVFAAKDVAVTNAISHSFAFGGHNAALLLSRVE